MSAVWLFDVDGTLVDSMSGRFLRPLVPALFSALTKRGTRIDVWSAGGAVYARGILDAHGLAASVSCFHDKVSGDRKRWLLPIELTGCDAVVTCVDDDPERLPDGVRVVGVFPYLGHNPNDRALEAAMQLTDHATTFTERYRDVLLPLLAAHRQEWGASEEWDALVAFQQALGAAGWGAPAWSFDIGGQALSVEEQLIVEAELGRVGAPKRVSVYGINNVGPTIAAVGTPEQKRRLDAMRMGTEFWCQGFSEPDFGSDLGGLRCRADVVDDGFIINGQKVWTSIGIHATHCMVLARTDPEAAKHRGISALLVPMDTPGVSRRPIRQIDGQAEFAELFFESVFVPSTALLGPLHGGWGVTMATLAFERTGVLGISGSLADEIDHAVRGLAHGEPSAVMRDRAMATYSRSRILAWMGARALGETSSAGAVSSLIKLAWSRLGVEFAELRADLVGLDSIAVDSAGAGTALLTSRANTIAGGTTEVMKNLIGERDLGLPK